MRTIYDMDQRCAVYFLYGDHDVLLYVGISKQPDERLWQHYQTQPWAFLIRSRHVVWMDTRREALDAERHAIETDVPLFNKALAQHDYQRWHNALVWMQDSHWALNRWRLPALARVVAAEPRFWNLLVDLHGHLESADYWCADCMWDQRYKRKVQELAGYQAENPAAQGWDIYELAVSIVYEALPNGTCDVHSGVDDEFDDAQWDVA